MCGIVGIVNKSLVNQDIFDALTIMQHRGQDAAGIMTADRDKVYLRKSNGLVRDVVRSRHMLRLQGNQGIGHVRYPTAGSASAAEAQPFYVNSPYGLSIVHNGNIINADQLTKELFASDLRHLNTSSDSEILLNIFAHELQQIGEVQLTADAIFQAVKQVHQRCLGAYAVVIMIMGYGIVAFRDPYGIRPLVYGKRTKDDSAEYMVASESIALDNLGYELIDDVQPGEAVFINLKGECVKHQCVPVKNHTPCLFEYVYLARPDSIIDHILVYKARYNMGIKLAEKIMRERKQHDIDVVIPIPDSSRHSALALAQTIGVKFIEGFIKNRYIGRTFIMPGQTVRQKSVRQKLNAIAHEFKDKVVLLVDDSIVRGNTSKQIIQMARQAGAKKVYFASAAAEVKYPNVYGIDMPTSEELIAHDNTIDAIAKAIGADWLIYQDLNDLYDAVRQENPNIKQFEDSVFTGKYITGGVDQAYLQRLTQLRNDAAKSKSSLDTDDDQMIDMFNPEE